MNSVFLSFLDRNKVVKCPIESDNGVIPYLKKEFCEHFHLKSTLLLILPSSVLMRNGKSILI